jgi:general stress protein 26
MGNVDPAYSPSMTKDKLQLIDDLIQSRGLCALATSDGRIPHVSLMNYFVDHAAMKFYFLSPEDSLKTKNLRKCPYASLLIDRREEDVALTIEGVFSPIRKKQTVEAIIRLFILRHPHMESFAKAPGTTLLRIEAREGQLMHGLESQFKVKFKNS